MSEHLVLSKTGSALTADEIAANFADLHAPLTAQLAGVQASRCLVCHDAPCVTACPTAIDIPKFIRQIATQNPSGAARTILSANIMGGTCARACPTEILCEQKCVLKVGEDEPVPIGALQRHAVDHLLQNKAAHPFVRQPDTGKKVAVLGAGPAGLACAHALAVQGHSVQIFEARSKPGGLNEYGLAAYKMVDDFAAREVAFILEIGGIAIRYEQRLSRDFVMADLREQYDAVFVGIGLEQSRRARIAGDQLNGVVGALGFIEQIRQADDLSKIDPGQQVVVIGGGNTAVDAAIQAKRLGARQVTLAYRRGPKQMGATLWEQDLAATNGINMVHWVAPQRFVGEGGVINVHFERMALQDGALSGTGEHFTLLADRVYLAIGQSLNENGLNGLEREAGKVWVDERGQTSLSGVFAGGDCVASGEDLTVQAVQDGKTAAAGIHCFLEGQDG